MKSVAEKLRILRRNPFPNPPSPPSSVRRLETSATASSGAALTEQELNQINDVIPRLCSSNHLKEAIRLISAAMSTANPPPLTSLIDRLALEPDLTHPMHLLNALKHNPATGKPFILMPVATTFVSLFFRNGRPKSAAKIFQWVSRPDFPGEVVDDSEFYDVLVDGFCKNGMVLEGLGVLRFMVSGNLVVGSGIRRWIYRGLLREARVKEALEVNAALGCCTPGSEGGTFRSKEVVDLLDRMIANWVE